jgi:hypothetical protein
MVPIEKRRRRRWPVDSCAAGSSAVPTKLSSLIEAALLTKISLWRRRTHRTKNVGDVLLGTFSTSTRPRMATFCGAATAATRGAPPNRRQSSPSCDCRSTDSPIDAQAAIASNLYPLKRDHVAQGFVT